MTVEIYEADDDYEQYDRVAIFERGEWKEGGDQLDPSGFYADQAEGLVLRDFDGPQLVAVDADKATDPKEAHSPSEHDDPAEDDAQRPQRPVGNQSTLEDWG